MANSPSHKFGQIIGDLLELAMIKYCLPISKKYSLYMDYRHPRIARKKQREVRWKDINDNIHKLDIVMEDGGSEEQFGYPRVFIEIAWRRYTKHSKNKAQEISAALLPLVQKYQRYTPFYGAVLAGDFTDNSLNQLRSEGFRLVYFPLETIEKAFSLVGIDAHWDEDTEDSVIQDKVDKYAILEKTEINTIIDGLLNNNKNQLEQFKDSLCQTLERRIEKIRIISVYGKQAEFETISEACQYILTTSSSHQKVEFYKFEIYIRYTNGDKMEMEFRDSQTAIAFLNQLI